MLQQANVQRQLEEAGVIAEPQEPHYSIPAGSLPPPPQAEYLSNLASLAAQIAAPPTAPKRPTTGWTPAPGGFVDVFETLPAPAPIGPASAKLHAVLGDKSVDSLDRVAAAGELVENLEQTLVDAAATGDQQTVEDLTKVIATVKDETKEVAQDALAAAATTQEVNLIGNVLDKLDEVSAVAATESALGVAAAAEPTGEEGLPTGGGLYVRTPLDILSSLASQQPPLPTEVIRRSVSVQPSIASVIQPAAASVRLRRQVATRSADQWSKLILGHIQDVEDTFAEIARTLNLPYNPNPPFE
jgi:hypothetical protein